MYFFAGTSKSANLATDDEDESEYDEMVEEKSMESGSPDDVSISDGSFADNDAEEYKKMGVATNQFVIVQYEGQQFPGKVTSVESEGAVVSVLTKCKRKGWKWPQTKDEMLYEWDDIITLHSPAIPLNKRNIFRFPDLEDIWGM